MRDLSVTPPRRVSDARSRRDTASAACWSMTDAQRQALCERELAPPAPALVPGERGCVDGLRFVSVFVTGAALASRGADRIGRGLATLGMAAAAPVADAPVDWRLSEQPPLHWLRHSAADTHLTYI